MSGQSLLIRGALLLREHEPQHLPQDLLIRNGAIERISPTIPQPPNAQIINAPNHLITPPFVESHVHLDSALVDAGRCINQSGTLFEGIERWREIKQTRTIEDILETAEAALRMQARHGTLFVRSHADVSERNLRPLHALLRLKEKVKDWITLQIVAFPQDGLYGSPDQLDRMEESLKLGADVVGGIPHYERSREAGTQSVEKIFELAAKYDRPIDIHCDETDDPTSRFLEVMAHCAIRDNNGPRVTASHTTAFGSYEDAYANQLFDLLHRANINFVANPLINLVLQGRRDTYPKRRGITRVKELWQRGHNVSLGYDCLMDPWYPLGTGHMLDPAHMAVHACHMTGKQEIDACYNMVTRHGAQTLGLDLQRHYDLKEGNPANLILLPVENPFHAIRLRPKPTHVISRGKLLPFPSPAGDR